MMRADVESARSAQARFAAQEPTPISEFSQVAAGQAAALITTALAVKLLSGMLGPTEYGRLALMLTLSGLPNMLLFGPLGQGVSRFVPNASVDSRDARIAAAALRAQRAAAVITLGLAAAVALLAGLGVGDMSFGVAAGAVLCGIAPGFMGNIVAALTACRRRVLAGAIQAGEPAIRLFGAFVLMRLAPRAEWALFGGAVATAAFVWVINWRVGSHVDVTPGPEDRRALFEYALPFAIGAGPAIIITYADRWIVGTQLDSEAVGLYVLALQVSSIAVLPLVSVLNQYFMPIVFASAAEASGADGRRLASVYMARWIGAIVLCAVPAGLASYLWSREIVTLASSSAYADAAVVLPIAVAATALLWVGNIGCIEAEVIKMPRLTLLPKMVHAVTFVVAGVAMTRYWGVVGMASAALLSAATFAISVRLTVGREYRKTL